MTPQPLAEHAITGYYEEDHDRLDGLFREFQRLKRSDFLAAKKFFKEFKIGLQRHIVWEEDILFPVFEQKTGLSEDGPTAVMRREHVLIGEFLEAIHAKVKRQDPDTDDEEGKLLQTLALHNRKEEQILYPTIDAMLSKVEREEIFRAMTRIPEERYHQCCSPNKNT